MATTSLVHADIFFFISTIALVLISAGLIVALVYGIRILRNIRDITDRAKEESSEIIADLKKLRLALRDEGIKWKHVTTLIRTFFMKKPRKMVKNSVKDETGMQE